MNRIALIAAASLFASPVLAQEAAPMSWLFIQSADGMTFDGTTLVLTGVDDTIAFTDRPYRIATQLPVADFVTLWTSGPDGFSHDAPNAGVSAVVDGTLHNGLVILGQPHFDGTTLTFAVTLLGGALPPAGQQVSVFIDAIPTPVNGQITDAVTQTNTEVVGEAPAISMGTLYQTIGGTGANTAP